MPYGTPKHVKPWERENWPVLNRGKKLYAISEWQCWLIRNGNAIPDLPQVVADDVGHHVSWISTKAKNLFDHIFADRVDREQRARTPSPGRPSPPPTPGPPTLHTPGIGDRNLRNAQPPTLRREDETSSDEDETPGAEAVVRQDHQVSESDSEFEQGEFDRELGDFIYALKYRKQDVCLHKCNKKIHIIVQ